MADTDQFRSLYKLRNNRIVVKILCNFAVDQMYQTDFPNETGCLQLFQTYILQLNFQIERGLGGPLLGCKARIQRGCLIAINSENGRPGRLNFHLIDSDLGIIYGLFLKAKGFLQKVSEILTK